MKRERPEKVEGKKPYPYRWKLEHVFSSQMSGEGYAFNLVASVLAQACVDLNSRNRSEREDAESFLQSEDWDWWSTIAGLDAEWTRKIATQWQRK